MSVVLLMIVAIVVTVIVTDCLLPGKIDLKRRPSQQQNPYGEYFVDKNFKHLDAAQRFGIEPLASRQDVEKVKSRLVPIRSCKLYKVDRLTHSVPYLTPAGGELLEMIGRGFRDSLERWKIKPYRIVVTSLLRTQDDVKRLITSGNENASSNSAHCYATTFDIGYKRFDAVGGARKGYRYPADGELQRILAGVIKELRHRRLCYVIRERKQPCYHITVRK